MSMPIGVLISGRGSNLQALIQACAQPGFPAHIALVIANKADAYGLQIAADNGIETALIAHNTFADKAGFENEISAALRHAKVQLVCLAGFMRILSAEFVEEWYGKLINIHPSLLPALKGLNTHARAIEAGLELHGCTVHYVSAKMDAGPVIAQTSVPVLKSDNPASLAARVLTAEHILYPNCLKAIASGRVFLENDRVVQRPHPNAEGAIEGTISSEI